MPSQAIVGPSVSVVLFLPSESIDGGIKGKKKYALTWAFRAERERGGEGERGPLEILKPYCWWPLTGASSKPAMRAQSSPGIKQGTPAGKPCL